MRAINLLPPEALEGAKIRRRRWLALAAALVFIALLAVATVWFQGRVDERKDELTQEQAGHQQPESIGSGKRRACRERYSSRCSAETSRACLV